jgi:hypothetical protein
MADFVLMLGSVAFQYFEIPEEIAGGGAQAMAVRKYAGGVRTIDAMGPDDDALQWSGWFEGPTALLRCQQLDIMRRQGVAVNATWSAYSYLVVIKRFTWKFKRYYHYSYEIQLEVVQDLSFPPNQSSPDVESQMQSDLSSVVSDVQGITALVGAP